MCYCELNEPATIGLERVLVSWHTLKTSRSLLVGCRGTLFFAGQLGAKTLGRPVLHANKHDPGDFPCPDFFMA